MYEAKGLLPAAARTMHGYRLYDDYDVELLIFIRRAGALGLHMDDIRKILDVSNRGIAPCATVRALLDARITELDSTVAELLALRETLVHTRQQASDCTEQRPITVCGIIEDAVTAFPN